MRIALVLVTVLALADFACSQTRFELTAPSLNRTSQATLSARELRVVDQAGIETRYSRAPSLDSADGRFLAYQDGAGGQVIRWPASNSGSMQIGTNSGGAYEFRTSQMQIVARDALDAARNPNGLRPNQPPPLPVPPGSGPVGRDAPVLPPGGGRDARALAADDQFFADVLRDRQPQPQVMRLAIRDDRGRDWFLGKSNNNRLAMHGAANPAVADWHIVPTGRGYVRVAQRIGNDWLAVAATQTRSLTFEPLGQQAAQLWRVMQTGVGSGYWLESAILPGYALTGAVSGAVSLIPVNGGFGQVWVPEPVVIAPGYEPIWRTVNHEVRANPALPPAQIELVNSHSAALRILVADRRTVKPREVRIEPNSRVLATFERDAGATVVETYELRGPSGLWDRQQFVTQIPPSPIYDLSVYEEFLQSIAIDRTGTSPNPIEDVNYQPKSIGWLPLPPGNALPARGQIDAYEDAKSANNPGAVRRFDRASLEKPNTQPDPLKTILENAAPKPRQKF